MFDQCQTLLMCTCACPGGRIHPCETANWWLPADGLVFSTMTDFQGGERSRLSSAIMQLR